MSISFLIHLRNIQMPQTSKMQNIHFSSKVDIKEIPQVKLYLEETVRLNKTRYYAKERKIPVIEEETGRLLEAICFAKQPERVLEIGCGTGYSTYFLLKHILLFFGSSGTILENNKKNEKKFFYTGIDLNRDRISEARKFINEMFVDSLGPDINDRVCLDFIHGNAIKLVPELTGCFDMVFIDAAKLEYQEYAMALDGKLEEGCFVIADNIFYSNKVFQSNTAEHDANSVCGIRDYISYMSENIYFRTVFLNAGDGLALSVYKKVS